ncbi:MAG TPA: insulinase family protein [Bacteroidetes bacterium]|nr:insulinase family protein [Bacteroidota bacterium]HEX04977.1 insulinase family protein [Bacteroidota bacterium]
MDNFRKTTLDNGVRVITEHIDHVRSAAIGFWFETGSRDENPDERGISHFLEHMLFKGTGKRSALQIAREIEQVGGHLNAFTSKELTVYHASMLNDFLPLAVDTLADMASHSQFADKMIEREQGVVLEEISGSEDSPEDVVHEDFSHLLYGKHPLGSPILGTRDSVSSFTRDDVLNYWSRRYKPENMLISAAGAVDHDKVVKLVERKLNLPSEAVKRSKRKLPKVRKDTRHERRKPIVQAHLTIGGEGLSYASEERYPFFVMNTVLGGGMSSRLFQRLRERSGLAYSVYPFHEAYHDSGLYGVYVGLEEKQVKRAEKMIREELQKLINKPISKASLKRAKDQLKGGLTLGLESSAARMHRLARMDIYLKRFVSLDELLEGIDSVSIEGVQEVSRTLFDKELIVATVLPDGSVPQMG